MGIFSRRKNSEAQESTVANHEQSAQSRTTEAQTEATSQEQVATETTNQSLQGGLLNLVQLMRAEGSGQLTLELKQTGNDMQLVFFENDTEKESLVVVPGNKWFAGVAELYTDEEQSERGPFNRALIVVNGESSSTPVQASFMNTENQVTHNLNFSNESASESTSELQAESAVTTEQAESHASEQTSEDSQSRFDRIGERINARSEQDTAPSEESFADVAFSADDTAEVKPAVADTSETAAEDEVFVAEQAGSDEKDETTETAQSSEAEQQIDSTADHGHPHIATALPSHVDDDFESIDSEADSQPEQVPAQATPSGSENELPETAEAYDIAPSYHKPDQPVAKPSTTAKAEGNLVLTEAEVVSRLAEAQKALFGANGTARDVSTVLIRIRSLGSYYDALTHVRAGGFWDQKKTFELIPEDVLNVLQLKADSYREGLGSPLAISLRFTPGIPPVASFDYSNEEAFAKYSDHLPAQQYIEELRMFPRTGANIPEHMNEALTSWSF